MRPMLYVHPFMFLALVAAGAGAALAPARPPVPGADPCPWVHSTASIPARVAQVLSQLTLDEKIQLVHGAAGSGYVGYVPAIPRLCIPALKLEDGPGGVADGVTGVTQLPAPVAVAASWDTSVARAYGARSSATRNGARAPTSIWARR